MYDWMCSLVAEVIIRSNNSITLMNKVNWVNNFAMRVFCWILNTLYMLIVHRTLGPQVGLYYPISQMANCNLRIVNCELRVTNKNYFGGIACCVCSSHLTSQIYQILITYAYDMRIYNYNFISFFLFSFFFFWYYNFVLVWKFSCFWRFISVFCPFGFGLINCISECLCARRWVKNHSIGSSHLLADNTHWRKFFSLFFNIFINVFICVQNAMNGLHSNHSICSIHYIHCPHCPQFEKSRIIYRIIELQFFTHFDTCFNHYYYEICFFILYLICIWDRHNKNKQQITNINHSQYFVNRRFDIFK